MERPALTLLLIFIDLSSFPLNWSFSLAGEKLLQISTGLADEKITHPTWSGQP
ncbi:MAG: hypothetical protein M3Y72_24265 [Acidobacteriota bacterium]|nr:hypothetical protein [Acidobacteriota bacterium]